ncbi:MAG: stage sporulation protein [Pelosinus sp.]|jgi:stage III sporulation protein AF|nr:stage sporulation protein [Pelosinus sp.]
MLTDWIRNIIFVILFASFLELLLPSSSMQRFVRVIMGLFIMLAILNPIIDVVQYHLTSTNQIPALSTNSEISSVITNEMNHVTNERDKLSLDIYKKELSQQMRILIMAVDGVADANVVVDINSNTDSGIKSIVVYIKPGISTKGEKIASIKEIRISTQSGKTEELYTGLKERITEMIMELYQIPKEKVEIRMLHS